MSYEEYVKFNKFFEIFTKPFQRVNPNIISIVSFLLAAVSAVLFYREYFIVCLCCLFVSQFFDGIDGYVARKTGRASNVGFLLDHVLDRCSDICIFYGIAFGIGNFFLATTSCLIIIFSSYIGVLNKTFDIPQDKSGIFNRSKRLYMLLVTYILIIIFSAQRTLIIDIFLYVSIALGLITTVMRIFSLFKGVHEKEKLRSEHGSLNP